MVRSEPLIAVLTCRRGDNTCLADTLAAIDREGGAAAERVVFIDGPAPDDGMISVGDHVGSLEAIRRVLVRLAPTGRDVLFFEDDLAFCRDAVTRMLATPIPADVARVSFFDMKEFPRGTAPGLYRTPPGGADGRGLFGNQSFAMPAEVVAWLAAQDWTSTRFSHDRSGSDTVMGELLARHPTRACVAYHIPCLVEHVGIHSVCYPGVALAGRTATNFPGVDFDALTLPPFTAASY